MPEAYYDQMCFSQGELDPRTQARADWQQYYKSAKQIRNCLVIPQGGVQRRFGLNYVDTVTGNPANPAFSELSTLLYDDNSVYLLSWTATSIDIYLENIKLATVVTQYNQEDIPLLRFAQVENRVIIVSSNFNPQQLVRSANAANIITGVDLVNNRINITNALTVGTVYPATFTTAGNLPVTNPQIYVNRTYFIRPITANSIRVYSTSADALADVNFYLVTGAGVGVSNVIVQNTWAITNIAFKFQPAYDYDGGYFAAGFTFTPSAVSGNITLTASGAIFTPAMVGGLYSGHGGIMRLTGFTSNVQMTGFTIADFPNVNPIRGDLSFLGEPAWSNNRGWPRTVSMFQNRLVFAGNASLPNGIWLSVVNDVYNFDDSEQFDDNAISWYPAAGSISFIRSITSCRSLIFHTNTGTFSTPVTNEIPLTPKNFTLTEQNKFGSSIIQPVYIDNQILFTDISGNNVIVMLWEITQSSYVTNNKSVPSSILIDHPVDMAALAVPDFTDGFYALFVNRDGTLAILQTLLEQEVSAITLSNTVQQQWNGVTFNQTNGLIYRVQTGNNRCWFTVQRQMPVNQAPTAISGFNAANATLQSVAHLMVVGTPTMVTFTTTGVLPTTVPQITTTAYFWAVATDANNFRVYLTQSDATNDVNRIAIVNAGVNSNVVRWLIQPQLFIEELDFTVPLDSATKFRFAAPTNTLTGLAHLNGQYVWIIGDDFILQNQVVVGGQLTLERTVTTATVGIQFVSTLTPLPVTVPQTFGLLYKPKHIRNLYLHVYNTLGITCQGITVPELEIQNIIFGQVPIPQTGVFEVPLMEGWNGFEFDLSIQQSLPLPMTIMAVSYILEI